jgi:hypothetical protein
LLRWSARTGCCREEAMTRTGKFARSPTRMIRCWRATAKRQTTPFFPHDGPARGEPAMAISVICPNGHELKIKDKYAGRKGLCPKCNAVVNVPDLAVAISEQAVIELLGPSPRQPNGSLPVHQEEKHRTKAGDDDSTLSGSSSSVVVPKTKFCPKCRNEISATFHVCPHCRTYFDESADIRRATRPDCPICGTACLPGDISCAACGTDLRRLR